MKAAGETFINLSEAFLLLWVGERLTNFDRLLLVHGVSSVKVQFVRQRVKIGRRLGKCDAVVGNGGCR